MAAVVGIGSSRDVSIDVRYRNQPNNSRVVLHKPLLSL